MKIRPVVAELFLADRRTDMTKVIVAFRNFANAPKNCYSATRSPSCLWLYVMFIYITLTTSTVYTQL